MIEWWESFIVPISIYYIKKYVKEVMSLLIRIKYERNYLQSHLNLHLIL